MFGRRTGPPTLDANTARFLTRVGRPLPVLADPSSVAAAPRPADALDLFQLRTLARDVRQHTVDHLDAYLDALRGAVERAGGHVHFAPDAAAARRIVAELCPPVDGDAVLVPASAVCDEIGLAPADVADPAVAVVGVAFAVAETGQLCLASDDAGVAAAAGAGTLIGLAGIESVVPRTGDLAVMLKLLARSASGRPMTAYTALVGPKPPGRTLHLVLLDNGRADLLIPDARPVLRCIGCGACTNVCPVYRAADVRPSGLWAGPVGAIVRARLSGDVDLPHASTLCGACAEACPVRIDLPAQLIALRARSPRLTRRLRFWAWVMQSPTRYRWATRWRRRRQGDGWPLPPRQSFHDLWRQRARSQGRR